MKHVLDFFSFVDPERELVHMNGKFISRTEASVEKNVGIAVIR
jgi:hypothetical protein